MKDNHLLVVAIMIIIGLSFSCNVDKPSPAVGSYTTLFTRINYTGGQNEDTTLISDQTITIEDAGKGEIWVNYGDTAIVKFYPSNVEGTAFAAESDSGDLYLTYYTELDSIELKESYGYFIWDAYSISLSLDYFGFNKHWSGKRN